MTTDQKNNVGLWNGDPVVIVRTPSAFAKQSLLYIQELGYFQKLLLLRWKGKNLPLFCLSLRCLVRRITVPGQEIYHKTSRFVLY